MVIAIVLVPLGLWLLADRGLPWAAHFSTPTLGVTAAIVGCVGGIYGIGGGAILAPILIGSGRSAAEVAPATLASTLISPFKTWLVVVAVSAISYGSYVIQKATRGKGGVILAALLGGAYSSTVTTIVLSRRANWSGGPTFSPAPR